MFIYNIKVSGSKLFKAIFIFMIFLLILIVGMVVLKIFNGAANSEATSSCVPQGNINKIKAKNYSNVLKAVHDNIDNYVGKKINFTGFVYRVYDLNDTQFVLARDMIVSSDFKSVIVGFLCEYDKASEFKDGTWVEITGEITKANYHGDMPIIKVTEIKKIDAPNEEFVYPPDDSYIVTEDLI
jgi:putative membrane protein